ncbi:MAG: hypothetical protein ACT4N2_10930 [Hyphomicrobium sp.]
MACCTGGTWSVGDTNRFTAVVIVVGLAGCEQTNHRAPMSLKDDVASCISQVGAGISGVCKKKEGCFREEASQSVAALLRDEGIEEIRGRQHKMAIEIGGTKKSDGWASIRRLTSPCRPAGWNVVVRIGWPTGVAGLVMPNGTNRVIVEVCNVDRCDPTHASGAVQERPAPIPNDQQSAAMGQLAEAVMNNIRGSAR